MGTIISTNGFKVLLDDDMLEKFGTFKINVNSGYAKVYMNGRSYKLHRLVIGANLGEIVDHINHDKLDNRRINLRIVTHAQNMANRVISHNNTSGYKGVAFDTSMSRRKRWGASINHMGKKIKIGRYLTPEEAAKAYDQVALKLKGQYALLNFRRIES